MPVSSIRVFLTALAGVLLAARALAAPGDLDPSFGTGGVASDIFLSPAYFTISGMAVQSDGKIIVAGTYTDDLNSALFALVRFNTNGSVDTGFGNGEKATAAPNIFGVIPFTTELTAPAGKRKACIFSLSWRFLPA